tara:strand:+ start:230 stop:442 length:213 start_codon:yes stop_codon:yes gene_type:complete
MRERANQVEYDDDQYHYGEARYSTSKKRLDLNDLLQRVKNEKRDEKKSNLIIYAGVTAVILVFASLFSIY